MSCFLGENKSHGRSFRFHIGVGIFLALFSAGCRTGRPDYTVNVPPNLIDIRPTRSVAFIETTVRLDGLQQAIDRALPGGAGGSQRLGALPVSWRLTRQPVVLGPGPKGLLVRVPLLGELTIGAGFLSCRSTGIGGTLVIAARPTFDPQGALELADAAVSFEPAGNVQCAGLPIPVAELFPLMLLPAQKAIEQTFQHLKLPLGPALQRGLVEVATPRELKLGGQPSCLDLAPSALVLAPLGGVGSELVLRLGLEVAPRVSLGTCPAGGGAVPSTLTVRQEALGNDYRVQVAVAVPTTELRTKLAQALLGRRLGQGPRALTVQAVEVGDAAGRVLVRLDVQGGYNGAVYLWGTPQVRINGDRYVLEVPDLQVATESTSRLEDTKIALYELVGGNLADQIKPQLQLDVTAPLVQAKAALSGTLQLDRKTWQSVPGLGGITGVAMISTMNQLLPQQVESRPGVVVLYVQLVGRMQLVVR